MLTAAATPPPAAIRFHGETTDGKTLTLPDDRRGKPLILVVGLSKDSSNASEIWEESLVARAGNRADVIGVAVLDDVPGFLRGYVRRAIDKQIGPPRPGAGEFVTTFDGKSLRDDAPAGNADDPVIFVFRADGSVASIERSPFSAAAAARIGDALP